MLIKEIAPSPVDSIVIEFYGFSGVGKTSAAKALEEVLLKNELKVNSSWRLNITSRQRINSAAALLVIRIGRLIGLNLLSNARPRRLLRGLYADLVRLDSLAYMPGVSMMDQGPLQKLMSLQRYVGSRLASKSIRMLTTAYRRPATKFVLVVLSAPYHVIQKRLLKRDGAACSQSHFDSGQENTLKLLEQLSSEAGQRLYVLDINVGDFMSPPDLASRIISDLGLCCR